jgi:hypothetical protein
LALAKALGVELHPAGTAERLQELEEPRPDDDCLVRALMNMANDETAIARNAQRADNRAAEDSHQANANNLREAARYIRELEARPAIEACRVEPAVAQPTPEPGWSESTSEMGWERCRAVAELLGVSLTTYRTFTGNYNCRLVPLRSTCPDMDIHAKGCWSEAIAARCGLITVAKRFDRYDIATNRIRLTGLEVHQ